MFTEILAHCLTPLLSLQYTSEYIFELASSIADLLESNPSNLDDLNINRNLILDYIQSETVKTIIDHVLDQQTSLASHLATVLPGIADLDKLSTAALKNQLLNLPLDNQLSKDIYDLNFGCDQTLGEIIYQTRFNQGFQKK